MTDIARHPWVVCGREIGRSSGWDQGDTFAVILYDFEPADGVSLPAGTVQIHFEHGTAETFGAEGEVLQSVDLINAIKHLPIVKI